MKFEYLTYDDIVRINFEKTWLCLPVGPYEQHGPHLPVSADVLITRYLSESVCETAKNEKMEIGFIEGPALGFAPAPVFEKISKVPELPSKLFSKFLAETLSQFIATGFKNILIVTHHFDLRFLKSIMNAIAMCEKNHKDARIIEPVSAYYYSGEYDRAISAFLKPKRRSDKDEDRAFDQFQEIDFKYEIHADVKETSMMLYLHPGLVKYNILGDLKPFLINPTAEFLKLKFTFKDMNKGSGYLGTPGKATKEFGEVIFKQLRDYIIETSISAIKGISAETSIPLYIKAILSVI